MGYARSVWPFEPGVSAFGAERRRCPRVGLLRDAAHMTAPPPPLEPHLLRQVHPYVALALALTASGTAWANPFGYHEHDGFYLRVSMGMASLDIKRDTSGAGSTGSTAYGDDSAVGGASGFTELSIGRTPFLRVVVAATLLGNGLPATELRVASGSRIDLGTPLVFALLAPTVDIFPNPGGGFHAGGGVGLATSTAGVKDPIFSTIGGLGVGVTIAFGYDLWTSDNWSVGLAARGIVARIDGSEQASQVVGHERDTITS